MNWKFETKTGQVVAVSVAERRRYGKASFSTSLVAEVDGVAVDDVLESPWPCVRPSRPGIKWDLRRRFDIPATGEDVRWLRKMIRQGRVVVMSPEDREQFASPFFYVA